MKKQEIKAIKFDVEEVGKHVKSSKKRFFWSFSLDGRVHNLTLDFSFISGKVKLVADRRTLLENQLPTDVSFQHPFTLDGYAMNILQQGDAFELRVNNKVFSHLYNQAKTNTEFTKYEDEVKDIKVEEGSFQNSNKTMKLNIGGVQGMKKKNKTVVESQNWGTFGQSNNSGFPNFFNEGELSKPQVVVQAVKQANLLDQQSKTEEVQEKNITNQQVPLQQTSKEGSFVNFFEEPVNSTSPSEEHLNSLKASNEKKDPSLENMFNDFNLQENKKSEKPVDFFNQNNENEQKKSEPLVPTIAETIPQKMASEMMDFNTMQNLFATQMHNTMQLTPPQQLQPQQLIQPQPLQPQQPQQLEQIQFNQSNSPSKPNNIQFTQSYYVPAQVPQEPANLGDFNTMQNLFQTQAPQQQQINLQPKSQSPFDFLEKKSEGVSMSTFSGVQQNTEQSNFNTMQPGNALDLVDFSAMMKKNSDGTSEPKLL